MEKIGGFLERIKNIKPPDFDVRKNISEIVGEMMGENIQLKDISVRNEVVYIAGDSSFKSEIFLKKKGIIEKLKEKLPDNTIKDIN
ncbi:MAG: DUF721 domain-containing protein [Candidatus Vogelbacteria bacterium]|nr:DUF721 domain-containing protein [Candidatus Vogelbacteria bacterium]